MFFRMLLPGFPRKDKKMKLALISDTHGFFNIELADSIWKQRPDYILHMGDGVEDAHELRDALEIPLFAVRGNNDYGADERNELFFILEGRNIYMTHGHRQSVYFSRNTLYNVAADKEAHLVFYGHTHIFRDETIGGIRLINPGSPSLPRGKDSPGYAVLDLRTGELNRILVSEKKRLW